MNMLWSTLLSVITFMLLFGMLSAISAALFKAGRNRLHAMVSEQRAAILFTFCTGPLLISLLSVGLLFSPLGEILIDIHCHIDACDLHTPFISDWESLLVMTPLALILSATLLYAFVKLLRQHRRQLALWQNLSSPSGGYFLIDHAIPVAFTLGLFRPDVYVSRGLRSQLNDTDLEVVLQHETAHIRRRDNFTKFIASLSTLLFPPAFRMQLLADLQLAQEMCCDNLAARQQQDTLTVAQTLLRVNHCAHAHHNTALCGIKGAKIELRIKALLEPPVARLSRAALVCWLAVLSLLPVLITTPLHHLLERFL